MAFESARRRSAQDTISNTAHRWPSLISGDTLLPSASDVEAIEAVIASQSFHGEDDAQFQVWTEPPIPILVASRDPDIRRLRGLVKDGRFPSTCIAVGPLSHMPWQCALNSAIKHGLSAHARLLVESGAEVNGFPYWCFARAAVRFKPGRSPNLTLASSDELSRVEKVSYRSTVDLDVEVQARRSSRSRFWAEADFPRLDFPAACPESSLVSSARAGDTDTYEFLCMNGADEASWLHESSAAITEPSSISGLAAESPMHVAVSKKDLATVLFLLERGHRPDHFLPALPTRALSPLMLCLTSPFPWRDGLATMLPCANPELRTPGFGIHVLHIAVATLDISVVEELQAARASSSKELLVNLTKLRHSLLHIACLPRDNTYVNMACPTIAASAREFRTLAAEWKTEGYQARSDAKCNARGIRGRGRGGRVTDSARVPGRPLAATAEAQRQTAMIGYVLAMTSDPKAELAKQDIHGNTPLHYLAIMRDIELYIPTIHDLVKRTRDQQDDEVDLSHFPAQPSHVTTQNPCSNTWSTMRNSWGYTAQQLYQDNISTGNDQGADYNIIPFWQTERTLNAERPWYVG